MKRLGVLIAVSVALVLTAGCMTMHPAVARGAGAGTAAPRPAAVDSDIWPARWGDDKPGLGKGVIVPIDGPMSSWEGVRLSPWHRRLPVTQDKPMIKALAKGRVGDEGYRYRMEGSGAFIFWRQDEIPPLKDGPRGRDEPAFMFVFASGQVQPAQRGEPDGPRVEIERTWFAYYDHRRGGKPAAGEDPGKGTVVLLPGLFGIPEKVMDIMTATIRRDGWNVIRMLAPPARFVESTDFELDTEDAESPREAAAYLMNRIAETAYASEAAVRYVAQKRPGLSDRPVVLVGGSAGALALPATMLRDPDLYDAAVIIAGGANLLDIVSRSSYTEPIGALEFSWKDRDGPPMGEVFERFSREYLKYAPLDGANAASAFADKPVLMLQGVTDLAVPADSGDRLWAALGKPDRWMIQGNHMTVFLSLWLYTPKIMAWLDEHVDGIEK